MQGRQSMWRRGRLAGAALLPLVLGVLVLNGCSKRSHVPDPITALTPATHTRFPITAGPHAVDCDTCHGPFPTFHEFTCTNCHGHEVQATTDLLHKSVENYVYSGSSCYECHPTGARQPFDHSGITPAIPGGCAQCHAEGASFAALPKPGFTHVPISSDCGSCHLSTTSWKTSAAPGLTRDPQKDISVTALVPVYSGSSITAVISTSETLAMPMDHSTTAVGAAILGNCSNCHAGTASGSFYPGVFHASLSALAVAQPTNCVDCHGATTAAASMSPAWALVPTGFVGPTATSPIRTPASGEMKHDAVAWANGAPTTTALVTNECGTCHASESQVTSGWNVSLAGTSPAVYHPALTAAGSTQPESCLDCHANSRPAGALTFSDAMLPAGVEFDHAWAPASDCGTCHTVTGAARWTLWSGGRFHLPGSSAPQSCLPCHANERPMTTTNWTGIDVTTTHAPFDYVADAVAGTLPHGANQDCVTCHKGPGTGVWGSTQNWVGGSVDHATNPAAATTCVACHATQRPTEDITFDLAGSTQTMNHTLNGTGDCFGCHQATVTAGAYANWKNSSGAWPGGDWQGGQPFPGATPIGSGHQFVTVNEITLHRSGPQNLVTGMTTAPVRLYNQMLHTSSGVPSALDLGTPGSPSFPDVSRCWHCHTNDGASPTPNVTSWADGQFHSALSSYSARPGGPVTPLAQPSAAQCTDCHAQMRPAGIVEHQSSNLIAMDHNAAFGAGSAFASVAEMPCGDCHARNQPPGVSWSALTASTPDGVFHQNITGSTPADCTTCHYPLEADAPAADATSGTRYSMEHASAEVTIQNCVDCHAAALESATSGTAAYLWRTGSLHPNVPTQPRTCNDCHRVSEPPAGASTQSTSSYTIPNPANNPNARTTSNGGQWMNHGHGAVAGRDCVQCHASDARTSGSAWSKAALLHANAPTLDSCASCHGHTNGVSGAADGENNNLPSGLTDSSTITSAVASTSTGVPAGTHDQITHGDVNVSSHDCNFCHTQAGTSNTPGIQGAEWAQAKFHRNFGTATPLQMNGTTGRCSSCHMNIVPGPSFTQFAHASLTNAPGTLDCSSCHTWPGTGGTASPNWKGAAAIPGLTRNGQSNVTVTSLVPTWSGTTIASVAPTTETLAMPMNHGTTAIPSATLANCANCHAGAATGAFFPGTFHSALTTLGVAQPSKCVDCHGAVGPASGMQPPWLVVPTGFVGPLATNPARSPATGEMKHDAVAWTNGAPTTTQLVSTECGVCHQSAAWNVGPGGTTPVAYHVSLTSASLAQPNSCIDCHANSLATGVLTSANAALPANVQFDHRWSTSTECASCHTPGTSTQWTRWSGGRFHLPGSTAPQTCLPCHTNERPTSTANWTGINTSTTNSPFDYVASSAAGALPHGANQDCVNCHRGPGTGAWGSTQNWLGGHVDHATNPASRTTCITCHLSQRPATVISFTQDGVAMTMNHTLNGTGDCFGCHQATVTAGTFVKWKSATGSWPGGDWQGGQPFPGSTLIGSGTQSITVNETTLLRSGPNNLVTGMMTAPATLLDQMLHTSAGVPNALSMGTPGTAGYPDVTKCWHCHTNDGASPTPRVTSWINGRFHSALDNYSATPGGAVTPLPQPSSGTCADCHAQQRPAGIVEHNSSNLVAMDHSAAFGAGSLFSSVAEMPCGDCHSQTQPSGISWGIAPGNKPDGVFHQNINGSTPADCTTCHYPIEADTPIADATNGTQYSMKHASAEVAIQNCVQCHLTALSVATSGTAAYLWRGATFHPNTPAQPATCNDCHRVSEPAPNASTQSSIAYAIPNPTNNPSALTSSNGGQWMNHGHSSVAGRDCAVCHASDARSSGSMWKKSDLFHANVTTPTSCASCHGLTNGVSGATNGASNNIPNGLTNSSLVTSAAANSATGVPANTHDQINHADINVSGHDCNFCHTQAGPSTVPGIQGAEWAQAKFHTNFNASNPLITNGSSGRCSTCHMNVVPGASFTQFAHTSFTSAPGSLDCASCHTWPGTGTPSAANWKGAASIPGLTRDAQKDLAFTALVPTYSGTTISAVTSTNETLTMPMNHASTALSSATLGTCSNCHAGSATGNFYPGTLHSALATLGIAQPTKCVDCHGAVTQANALMPPWMLVPKGFIGPLATNPARTPASGEMKHDAVAWTNGAPTTTVLVSNECGTCHLATASAPRWNVGPDGTAPALYHSALTAASSAQPSSCIDCHANSMPAATLTSSTAALPAGVQYKHSWAPTPDCASCHTPGTSAQWTRWTGGRFHLAGDSAPTTCLPCHTNERPTSTTNWVGINVTTTNAPFDYVANATAGTLPHGANQDCVSCHNGPGTGAWGSTQNWQGGNVNHATNTAARTTCISCHVTQRPTTVISFTQNGTAMTMDHTQNGMGDCFGCHQATVTAGTYAKWKSATGTWPGGDWQGGQPFPGATLIGSGNQFVTVNEITLRRSGPNNLVTSMTSASATLYNEMLHTSAGIPSPLAMGTPGTAGYPDTTKCWHCHTNDGASPTPNVTSWVNGQFHSALSSYRATPTAAITPLTQPAASACADCHAQMRPTGIVEHQASNLVPMDHNATFGTGSLYASVAAMPCGTCHARGQSPGVSWASIPSGASDGVFHQNITGSTPADCTTCHYPLEADTAASDTTSGTRYSMKHGSSQVTIQNCVTCHTAALASATSGTAASLWRTGTLHPTVPAQPTACNDCHAVSVPAPDHSTQSSWAYTIPNPTNNPAAQTSSNGGQWMNHGATSVTGRDCASCHASDAKVSGSAWSKATLLHGNASPTTCKECHGHTNGVSGAQDGSNNNLPNGLTNASMITSAVADTTTGIPANTHDQITHSDINVSSRDCGSCHTQAGRSSVPGVQGAEWAQAKFHANVSSPQMNGTTGRCSNCHMNVKPGTTFAVFAHASFTNTPGTQDCSTCHTWPGTGTAAAPNWKGAVGIPGLARDPSQDVTVAAQIPTYSGTSITSVAATSETLAMPMDHSTTAVDATTLTTCTICHADSGSGVFYPGTFHSALANHSISQPTKCIDCHGAVSEAAAQAPPWTVLPTGFVGPFATRPARTPGSGEMKHDAVAWSNGAPTTTSLVSRECGQCHAPQTATASGWNLSLARSSPALYHPALTAAAVAQPGSCIDCHANSTPTGVLTSTSAALPANVQFDHKWTATPDCVSCHSPGGSTQWTAWSGGRFHLAGDATPTTCLPCHTNERPVSTTGWTGINTASTNSPFDYVANAGLGTLPHGAGQDCVNCHAGPGTGTWGSTQNWLGGYVDHTTNPAVSTTCISCHVTQRPTTNINFTLGGMAMTMNHTLNGMGDCIGCHQDTVAAGTYVNWTNPTGGWPGGDWQGGEPFPGATLIGSGNQFVTVNQITLNRSGANNLVTSMTTTTATLYNEMLHTSAGIPAALAMGTPGTAGYPDVTKCWHCHTNDGASPTPHVTSWVDGKFHAALSSYAATPGGAVTPLSQPAASLCTDCHAQMRPTGIVEHVGSDLKPMDHNATFGAGSLYASVAAMPCGSCHARAQSPGVSWTSLPNGNPDGVFHANISGSTPADCTTCHYPLEADTTASDLTSGTAYVMKHASTQVTIQNCSICHTTALASATTGTAATLWRTGTFHPHTPAQPTACNDCHSVSDPTQSTQSSYSYTIPNPSNNPAAQTSTNGRQWMNHASTSLNGKDCALCHATDAKASGSAWSTSTLVHTHVTTSTCAPCHGHTNGVSGAADGTNNNIPFGLTDSSTLTTASADITTGVPANTHDQIDHSDINVSNRDCNFCHTQIGISNVTGIRGAEWAQAKFHSHYTGSRTLTLNGTTGRCSHCHMNVRPSASFTAFDHTPLTNTSGTPDCAMCHSWPGGGGSTAPDWTGASDLPLYINVGGFNDSQPPATTTVLQPNVANLPHPNATTSQCTTCHTSGVYVAPSEGGVAAAGYDHASPVENGHCNACHEAGTNLLSTNWNGAATSATGAGDSRPDTLTTTVIHFNDGCTLPIVNHFYPVDCYECHNAPSGIALVTTGTTYLNTSTGSGRWSFPHSQSRMSNPSTCNRCHLNTGCQR